MPHVDTEQITQYDEAAEVAARLRDDCKQLVDSKMSGMALRLRQAAALIERQAVELKALREAAQPDAGECPRCDDPDRDCEDNHADNAVARLRRYADLVDSEPLRKAAGIIEKQAAALVAFGDPVGAVVRHSDGAFLGFDFSWTDLPFDAWLMPTTRAPEVAKRCGGTVVAVHIREVE